MKKVDTLQNFFLAFTDECEKQMFMKKLLKWANKKQNNFNNYNVAFLKKKDKEKHWRYYYFTPM